MNRSRFFGAISLILIMILGCSSNKKNVVVQVEPKFEQQEEWTLTQVRGKSIKYDEEQSPATIQFNPEAHTVFGCTGCNRFFGEYQEGPEGKIAFLELGSTKMACPEPWMKTESMYMSTLRKVDGFVLTEYRLELLQGEKVILVFEKNKQAE